jgi:Mg2+ and Co2+ transporter CorA
MLTNFICTSKETKSVSKNELKNYVKKSSTIWINIHNVENEEVAILREIFKIHPTQLKTFSLSKLL